MTSLISGIFSNYTDFFVALGYFGEYITFIITCALIFNRQIYFIFYIICFILERILNKYLKDWFKETRPGNPRKFLDSDKFSKIKFGMPSGHTQLTFFSITYAYLVTKNFMPWGLLLLLIGLFVIYQRYIYRNHTISQLISGALLGTFTAYISYFIVNIVMQKYS
jgi:membrane-associated phospholipid phosphatase